MKKAKLKACPFCGSPGAIKECHESHFVVQCTNEQCKASVFPPEMSPLAALTVWNTRVADSNASV